MSLRVARLAGLAMATVGAVTGPRLSILIFHRVHAGIDSLFPEEPDAIRFERLMRLVAGSFRVLRLGEAAERLANGSLPSRPMVITFDDGYSDNAEVALPILQRLRLPATFFVSTGFLDGGRMWNDSVIECLRACQLDAVDVEPFGLGRHVLSGASDRRAAIESLLPRIKYLSLAERMAATDRLCRICHVGSLPTSLMMRSEQVVGLHRAGMEIGGHTVHHPILACLPSTAAEQEIAEGRSRLQEIIDAPVDVFAYPNGKPRQDYEIGHVDIVRRLGFKAAVSTAAGVARVGDDPYQLPRFTPWDRSLAKWMLRLLLNQRRIEFDRASATAS